MMILLFLILNLAQAGVSNSQSVSANAVLRTPPDLQIVSSGVDPGKESHLELEKRERSGNMSSGLERADDGDRARSATDSHRLGAGGSGSMAASSSTDPAVAYSGPHTTFSSDPSPDRIVSEKVSFVTMMIRNTGTRTVKAIDWDYPYAHIQNRKAVLRYAFHSKASIAPGETAVIRGVIPASTKTFNSWQGKGPEGGILASTWEGISVKVPVGYWTEGAQILRVKYSDGFIWRRP